eukprot:COSAG01_NODE_13255_length_1611_cov_2.878307_1_plen_117_part_00
MSCLAGKPASVHTAGAIKIDYAGAITIDYAGASRRYFARAALWVGCLEGAALELERFEHALRLLGWHTPPSGPGAAAGRRLLATCIGESTRLAVGSPWSQFTGECQRVAYPPRHDK